MTLSNRMLLRLSQAHGGVLTCDPAAAQVAAQAGLRTDRTAGLLLATSLESLLANTDRVGTSDARSTAERAFVVFPSTPQPAGLTARVERLAITHRLFIIDDAHSRWEELDVRADRAHLPRTADALLVLPRDRAIVVSAALHSYALSGAERSHVEMVEDLLGHDVLVRTYLPEGSGGLADAARDAGSSVHPHPSVPWWVATDGPAAPTGTVSDPLRASIDPDSVLLYLAEFADRPPDVVLTQTVVNPHAAVAARMLGIPHVWWLRELAVPGHGLWLPDQPAHVGAFVRMLSDRVICSSQAVKDRFFPGTGPNRSVCPVQVIHPAPRMPADLTPHVEHPDPVGSSDPPSRPVVGVVGTLLPSKGQTLAVRAIGRLRTHIPEVQLVLFGSGSDEHLRDVTATIDQLDLGEHVALRQSDDRGDLYRSIDVLAIPSKDEGFGRVAFEAAASGIPIVYSDGGAHREFMVPRVTGMPFPVDDEEGLAAALREVLELPDRGRALAKSASAALQQFCAAPDRGSSTRDALHAALNEAARPALADLVRFTLVASDVIQASADARRVRNGREAGIENPSDGRMKELEAERDWWFTQFHQLRRRRSVRLVLRIAGLRRRLMRRTEDPHG